MNEIMLTAEYVRELLERAFREGYNQGYRDNDRSYCGKIIEFEESEILAEFEELIANPPF